MLDQRIHDYKPTIQTGSVLPKDNRNLHIIGGTMKGSPETQTTYLSDRALMGPYH